MTARKHLTAREAAFRSLVDEHYGGNFTQALVDLAAIGDIAVAWLDREFITSWMNRDDLTDDEWAAIRFRLDEYDQWVSDSDDVNGCFLTWLLVRAGFAPDDSDTWRLRDAGA